MPRTTFAGKQVLITGAASGIGRATAQAVVAKGARVVLTDVQADALEAVVAELGSSSPGSVLHHAALDITDHDAIVAFGEEVHAAHGSMDVVMNIAGISTWGSVSNLSHSDWRAMVEVDLMGPISVIETFVPPMVEAGRGGHLVNVSSAAGLIGLPWHAAYSAAKFGLRGVSEVLRFDLERDGIGVTLVCPGAVNTPLVGTVKIVGVDREHPAARKMSAEFQKRAATPEQVAQRIVRGVERGTYLVYTSRDIRLAHLLERVAPPAYRLVMRGLQRRMGRVAELAAVPVQRGAKPPAEREPERAAR
jgi:NAD(P)-dependent dehydrogenase (short-subunit alcohol dehydrogenase family)